MSLTNGILVWVPVVREASQSARIAACLPALVMLAAPPCHAGLRGSGHKIGVEIGINRIHLINTHSIPCLFNPSVICPKSPIMKKALNVGFGLGVPRSFTQLGVSGRSGFGTRPFAPSALRSALPTVPVGV